MTAPRATTSPLGARSQGADFNLNDLTTLVRSIIYLRLAELTEATAHEAESA